MDGKIFNLYQADKFMEANANAIGIKKEAKENGHKVIYVEFETDDKFYELMDKWNKRLSLK